MFKSHLRASFWKMSLFTACSTTHNSTVRLQATEFFVFIKRRVLLIFSNQSKLKSERQGLSRADLPWRRDRKDRSQGSRCRPPGGQLPARSGLGQSSNERRERSLADSWRTRHRSHLQTYTAVGVWRGLFAIPPNFVRSPGKTTSEGTKS